MARRDDDDDDDRRSVRSRRYDNRVREYMIILFMTILMLIVAVISFQISKKLNTKKEPDIDVNYITGKLTDISELSTSELDYTGIVKFTDGDIPFLTQKSFSMLYKAKIKAGIDMSKIKVTVTETKVTVTLPEVEITSVEVDPDSIEFYDEKFALFNQSQKQDVVDAISAATNDVEANVNYDELKNRSRVQAETIIKSILSEIIGERELEIN